MNKTFISGSIRENIQIKRGDKFNLMMSMAEADKATKLIGIALSMEELEELPSHIADTPFVIRFFADDTLALERSDTSGSIPFYWKEADELITAIHDGRKIAINERINMKNPRGTGYVPINNEPFI